jgi:UDPglucose 6-dehydrogenase
MKSIAAIGQGFVGGSLTTVFSERGFEVYAYDKAGKYAKGAWRRGDDETSLPQRPISIKDLVSICESKEKFSNVYFVCLPTPMYEDGAADLSIVESVLKELAAVPGERIAVIKSTVPPGSTERWNKKFLESGLRVIFNPEFLTEANALDDMRNQNRIILGGPRPWINNVKQVFEAAFPNIPVIKTSSTNAELVKYFTNCFLAMKISFANEMYQICQALDSEGLNADYDRLVEIATLDKRLGTSHWKVPSFETDENGKNLFGFGLSCFPKDINALITVAKSYEVDPKMLSATWTKNLEVRPQKDWEKLFGRAVSKKK